MKLISTINRSLGFKAKIYNNEEWSEYVVKFYNENGQLINGANYHSDDMEDAINTAHFELNRMVESFSE